MGRWQYVLFEHVECHGDDITRMDIMQFELHALGLVKINIKIYIFNIY